MVNKNKTKGCISSRTALRKTFLAQQDPFCVVSLEPSWSSHRCSGLLHTTYRPREQLAKPRAPAESERERLALGTFLSPNSPFPVAFSAASSQGRGAGKWSRRLEPSCSGIFPLLHLRSSPRQAGTSGDLPKNTQSSENPDC